MARTFFHDIEVSIGIKDSTLEAMATIEFTATPGYPATYDDPAEGGEVTSIAVIDLFVPAKASRTSIHGLSLMPSIPRQTLECPKWLSDWIVSEVSDELLFESLGADAWDEDPD